MCGTVGTGADDPLVRGMFASLMVMVSMPFALVAAVGGWFLYHRRRRPPPPRPEEGGPHLLDFRRD
jgi:hypothetical protein